jgi:hypothetical protein
VRVKFNGGREGQSVSRLNDIVDALTFFFLSSSLNSLASGVDVYESYQLSGNSAGFSLYLDIS